MKYCMMFCQRKTLIQHSNIYPPMKGGGGSIMILACFADSEPGWIGIIDGTIDAESHQEVLKKNVRTSVPELNEKVGHAEREHPQA